MTDPSDQVKWERLAVCMDVANGIGKGHHQFQEVFGSTYYHLHTPYVLAIPLPDIKSGDRGTHIYVHEYSQPLWSQCLPMRRI